MKQTPLIGYVDPFTGSLLLQLLSMLFIFVVIFFKKIRGGILRILGYKSMENEPEPSSVGDDSDDEHSPDRESPSRM